MTNHLTLDELEIIAENVKDWRTEGYNNHFTGSLENVEIKTFIHNSIPSYRHIKATSKEWPKEILADYNSPQSGSAQKTESERKVDSIYEKIIEVYDEQKRFAIIDSISKAKNLIRKLSK